MDRIAVINASTVLTDADLRPMVEAVEFQMDKHFYPQWGIPANLKFVPRGSKPPSGYWWLAVLDDADQAGALGYHDITPEGQPVGKVFAKTTLMYGGKVSVTLSHEVLEMLADPDVNLLVQDGRNDRRFWAYEVGDPVEADEYLITVSTGGQVPVTNFALPAYFESFRTSGPFDYLKKLTRPVPAMTRGGYMIYVDNGVWSQVYGSQPSDKMAFKARPRDGGRRYRRMLGRRQWIRSKVKAF